MKQHYNLLLQVTELDLRILEEGKLFKFMVQAY